MALRRLVDDFHVDERLTPEWVDSLATAWSDEHPYAIYRLTKTGLSTPDAVGLLCRALRVSAHTSSYAGLKDRHAVTSQHVSVRVADANTARGMQRVQDAPEWRARHVGWAAEELKASAIATNDFSLVVRGLNAEAVAEMDRRADLLADTEPADGRTLLLANYFGDQRFGSARHGQGFAAEPLVKGDFTEAIRLLVGTPARKDTGTTRMFTRLCAQHWEDWPFLAAGLPRCPERAPFERLAAGHTPAEAFAALPRFLKLMCLEAFQSYLWNDTVRRMVQGTAGQRALVAPDEFGELVFPLPQDVPASWRALEVPVLTPDLEMSGEWGPHAAAALSARGIDDVWKTGPLASGAPESGTRVRGPSVERLPYFGHASRAILAHAADFTMSASLPDDLHGGDLFRRSVRFSLPRGSYATVLMRALGQ
jgi:tRNA pseudouridine13 synthase